MVPFLGAGHNCWEHVIIFRKPAPGDSVLEAEDFPARLDVHPVVKLVRGENRHGHSAPFPDAIPELLCSRLQPGARVLDPFAGSLTTGRVAERFGLDSTCVELKRDYCELGLRRREKEGTQRELTFT